MGLSTFIFFFFLSFFFFFRHFCPGYISGTVTRRDSKFSVLLGSLVLRCNFALLLTIQFALLFFYFFIFFAKILSGPYLWNRYSQRLQIECAPWSCGLILHCCLPSNSLSYFFYLFFFFLPRFCHNFVRAISLEPLLAETPN